MPGKTSICWRGPVCVRDDCEGGTYQSWWNITRWSHSNTGWHCLHYGCNDNWQQCPWSQCRPQCHVSINKYVKCGASQEGQSNIIKYNHWLQLKLLDLMLDSLCGDLRLHFLTDSIQITQFDLLPWKAYVMVTRLLRPIKSLMFVKLSAKFGEPAPIFCEDIISYI